MLYSVHGTSEDSQVQYCA